MEEVKLKEREKLEFIVWFSKVDEGSKNLVGEKGYNLGRLFSKNFPVPNGFIVTTEAYLNFLKSSELYDKIKSILEKINFKDDSLIFRASNEIKSLILNAEFPEELKEEIIDSYSVLGANKIEIEKGSARDILNNAYEPTFVSIRSSISHKNEDFRKKREQDTYLNIKGNEFV